MIFKDRVDAGQQLVPKLKEYKNRDDVVVLGLPRGGVVNAAEVAKELNLPLDIVIVRKIGAPDNPELAIGAVAEGGQAVFNDDILFAYNINRNEVDKSQKEKEIKERSKMFRGENKPINLLKKVAIIIDDGIATGATVRAAILSVKAQKPKKIVLAIPVISREALEILEKEVDEIIYLDVPEFFGAVGSFYDIFDQVEDEEVIKILQDNKK